MSLIAYMWVIICPLEASEVFLTWAAIARASSSNSVLLFLFLGISARAIKHCILFIKKLDSFGRMASASSRKTMACSHLSYLIHTSAAKALMCELFGQQLNELSTYAFMASQPWPCIFLRFNS